MRRQKPFLIVELSDSTSGKRLVPGRLRGDCPDTFEGRNMNKLTTHRLIQLHNLVDDLSSRARVCMRGAANLERIGNARGAQYQCAKGLRFQAIAEKAARRVESGA